MEDEPEGRGGGGRAFTVLRKREYGWMASDSDFRREFRRIRRNQANPPLIIRLPALRGPFLFPVRPISNRARYLLSKYPPDRTVSSARNAVN